MDSELTDDQIRLVSILPADDTDALHVSRRHILTLPSESSPGFEASYIALSYFWGPRRASVKCDDEVLQVSSNLVPALKRLNRHFPNQLFWTDSISINQAHVVEKAHQVSMMGRIFAAAASVVVWFGEDTEDIYQDLDRLTEVDKGMTAEDASAARLKLVQRLSRIDWFYRAWTFQEIRLAKNAFVILDTELMPWRGLIDKIQKLRALEPNLSTVQIWSQPVSYSRFTYQPKDRFFAILDELNSGTSSDLAGLLFITWYRDATEKRDKVYSLLSSALFSDQAHGIGIDYQISWVALCVKTARACINIGSDLKILKIAGMTQRWKDGGTHRWNPEELRHLVDRPSWVPDWWSPPQQTRTHPSLAFDERGCFGDLSFCCPETPPRQSVDDLSRLLVLKGVLLGIMIVGDSFASPGEGTRVHAPPHCTSSYYQQSWIKKPESGAWRSASLQGVTMIDTAMCVRYVYDHLHRNCTCVPFHERPGRSLHGSSPFASPQPPGPLGGQRPDWRFSDTWFSVNYMRVDRTSPDDADETAESAIPAQVLAASVESGDWLVLLEGGGMPFVLRPAIDRFGHAWRPHDLMTVEERRNVQIPTDAGCFVLVGEASLCWDQLWPGNWDTYCRAGNFAIM